MQNIIFLSPCGKFLAPSMMIGNIHIYEKRQLEFLLYKLSSFFTEADLNILQIKGALKYLKRTH